MVQSQFSLSWKSYKSNICSGFSALQQNGEFVDMTLAADGHLVKVHQVLIALASPYLKELISSVSCQHPVIFLNNVPHRTLGYLLEYIYTGEVLVPAECLSSFVDTAKSLHIKGLDNMTSTDDATMKMEVNVSQIDDGELCHISGIKRMAVPSEDGVGQISLPAAARKITIKHDNRNVSDPGVTSRSNVTLKDDIQHYSDMIDDSTAQDSDDGSRNEDNSHSATFKSSSKDKPISNLQFTVSIRGSLQVILNRYIYNLHSTTHRTGVRRWRCVDYRNNKCMAFLVTKGNIVLNRGNPHNHPFHDKKILAKIEKKAVYSALDDVEGYKEKDDGKDTDNDTSMEQEELIVSLDFSGDINEMSDDPKTSETIVKHA